MSPESAIVAGFWREGIAATLEAGTDLSLAADSVPGEVPVIAGTADGVRITFRNWSVENYLVLPGAVYAGNRFSARRLPYSPRLEPEDIGPDVPTIITDVPRLAMEHGPSHLEQTAGSLALPAVGIFFPAQRNGLWLAGPGRVGAGEMKISVSESKDRRELTLRFTATEAAHGPDLRIRVITCIGESPAALLRAGVDLRRYYEAQELRPQLPLSTCAQLLEEKFNRENWDKVRRLYRTGSTPGSPFPWSTGWAGGVIAQLPLIAHGQDRTRERARQTLDTFFREGVAPSGFFFSRCDRGGCWLPDFHYDQARPHTHRWHLVRRSADALYYGLVTVAALRERAGSFAPPTHWLRALRGCADAFVRLWEKDGQFGQFIDQYQGAVIVGGSCSAALAPAALVRAYAEWPEEAYLRVARSAAEHYHRLYVSRGFSTGAPADACQCPDSESAVALLESYVALYESTGESRWLEHARDAAALCASWVMAYNYAFPPGSLFGRLGLCTRGTVFANVQNKHSAPGFCTHAGVGLLKLYLLTRERVWLELLRDVARALPQFISRPDRPLVARDGRVLPEGWINERVNTNSWEGAEMVGEVFYGSTWAEVSLLLTAAQLPGIYLDLVRRTVTVLDQVEAELGPGPGGELMVRVTNPTPCAANVRWLVDAGDFGRGTDWELRLLALPAFALPPGETRYYAVSETTGEIIPR